MLWFWILGVLAVLLVWLCLTRVGAQAAFSGGDLQVDVRIGLFRFRVFPGKEKKEAPERERPEKEKTPGKKGPKLTFADIREAAAQLWPPLRRALRRTRRGIRIDPMRLSVTLGGEEDPAAAAQLYGELQAAVWSGMPVLEKLLDIPEPGIHVGVDFASARPELEGGVGVTARIGTLLAAALGVGIPALKWFLRFRRRQARRPQSQKTAA